MRVGVRMKYEGTKRGRYGGEMGREQRGSSLWREGSARRDGERKRFGKTASTPNKSKLFRGWKRKERMAWGANEKMGDG